MQFVINLSICDESYEIGQIYNQIKCIIYQKDQAKVKLSTSEAGRATIRTCIEKPGDNFLHGLTEIGQKSCYSS